MPFLELSLTVPLTRQPMVENALDALGALSITLRDADAETADEQAIFEPGVGELPLWSSIHLSALLDETTDRPALVQSLADALPWLEPNQLAFRDVADENWERVWMDQFKPMQFGQRLWIYPWNMEPPVDDEVGRSNASCVRDTSASMHVVVRLDPGLAFGSGTHPTTALCLEWLDSLDLHDRQVVDYGCGSGILAIAALKLGARSAIGIDNDPQALIASMDNAGRNDVDERLQVYLPDDMPEVSGEVFVANILAGPLAALAPAFAAICQPGAPFALSGILHGQQDELLERYGAWFDALRVDTREEWVRISGRRR